MSDLQSDGQEHYRQAVLETSPLNFDEQLAAAEEAVFLRMEDSAPAQTAGSNARPSKTPYAIVLPSKERS